MFSGIRLPWKKFSVSQPYQTQIIDCKGDLALPAWALRNQNMHSVDKHVQEAF
jgi:hypothetical protein